MDAVDIDELDRKILNVLLEEGRKSFRKVADDVDSTPATVINRVDRLEDEGVLTGYSADIDYERLGFRGLAAIEVVVKGEALTDLKAEVADNDRVVTAYAITGDTDLLLLVNFRSREELNAFVQEELAASANVEKTITHVVLDVLKDGDEPGL